MRLSSVLLVTGLPKSGKTSLCNFLSNDKRIHLISEPFSDKKFRGGKGYLNLYDFDEHEVKKYLFSKIKSGKINIIDEPHVSFAFSYFVRFYNIKVICVLRDLAPLAGEYKDKSWTVPLKNMVQNELIKNDFDIEHMEKHPVNHCVVLYQKYIEYMTSLKYNKYRVVRYNNIYDLNVMKKIYKYIDNSMPLNMLACCRLLWESYKNKYATSHINKKYSGKLSKNELSQIKHANKNINLNKLNFL